MSRSLIRRLLAHPSGRRALIVIVLLILAAIIGPRIVAHSSTEQPNIVSMKSLAPSGTIRSARINTAAMF